MYKKFIEKVRSMKQQVLEIVKNINIHIDLLNIKFSNGETDGTTEVRLYTTEIETMIHEITHVIAYALGIFSSESRTVDIEMLPTICEHKYVGAEAKIDKNYYYLNWGGRLYFDSDNVKYDVETLIAYADILLLEYEDIYNMFIDMVADKINDYIIRCNEIDKAFVHRIKDKLSRHILEKLIQKNKKIKDILEDIDIVVIAKNATKEDFIKATISDILYSTSSSKLLDIYNNDVEKMKNIIAKVFNAFVDENEKLYRLYKLTVIVAEKVFKSSVNEVTDVFEYILRYLSLMLIIAPNETDDFYINNAEKELKRIAKKQAISMLLGI